MLLSIFNFFTFMFNFFDISIKVIDMKIRINPMIKYEVKRSPPILL